MPKNEVSDLITDQEIAFVHLILSGNMTDQRAAAAVGLNPNTAAYTKSKPMHSFRMPPKDQKDRILSNFIKTGDIPNLTCPSPEEL